jgi:hypothetical protein
MINSFNANSGICGLNAQGKVDSAKLINQIDTAQLAGDAVNGDKIDDDAVDSEHIVTGAIDYGHISFGSTATDLGGQTPSNILVPTQAAVKTYADTEISSAVNNIEVVSNLIVATKSYQSSANPFDVTGYTITGSNVNESSGVLTITGSGIWAVSVNGWVDTSNGGYDWYGYLEVNGATRIRGSTVDTANSDQALSGITFVDASSGSFTVKVRVSERTNGKTGTISSLRIEAIKLS